MQQKQTYASNTRLELSSHEDGVEVTARCEHALFRLEQHLV